MASKSSRLFQITVGLTNNCKDKSKSPAEQLAYIKEVFEGAETRLKKEGKYEKVQDMFDNVKKILNRPLEGGKFKCKARVFRDIITAIYSEKDK